MAASCCLRFVFVLVLSDLFLVLGADQFLRYPDVDHPSGTLDAAKLHSLETCAAWCLDSPGCIGFAFGLSGQGYCWLKNEIDTTSIEAAVGSVDVYYRTTGMLIW